MMLKELRREVCELNQALLKNGLVVWTMGNVSGLDRERGLVVIKPSGVEFEKLTPENMVVADLAGHPVEGGLRPSVDLENHLYLYNNDNSIGGVTHTHSSYATAFAAVGRPVPPVLTSMADEFGGEIPCTPYVGNQADQIGRAILDARTRAPAVLVKNHGVFTFGPTPEAALKAAVMAEDAARTAYLTLNLGEPQILSDEQIAPWWDRYHGRYGQDK